MIRILIIPDGSLKHTLLLDKLDNTFFNRELAKDGYAQNVKKQDTLLHLRRAQDTKTAERSIGGTPVVDLIHLGGYVNANGSNARE
eukprot:1871542-Pyramimonas_sp.AAC.1